MLKVKFVNPEALLPKKAHSDDAGFDLLACQAGAVAPGAHVLIPTGIAVEMPHGYYGRVAPRSGLAVKYGINVHAGVIDPLYRGEIKVALINHGNQLWEYRRGDRIAQLILERYAEWCEDAVLVSELNDSVRGDGGFGSTGL